MTERDFETIIRNDFAKIGIDLDALNSSNQFSTFEHGVVYIGIHTFVKSDMYHYVEIGDRGKVNKHICTENLDEVLYLVYNSQISNMASRYAGKNSKEGEDWRRKLFEKKLELLRMIGEKYYLMGKKEIKEILEKYPFNDGLPNEV